MWTVLRAQTQTHPIRSTRALRVARIRSGIPQREARNGSLQFRYFKPPKGQPVQSEQLSLGASWARTVCTQAASFAASIMGTSQNTSGLDALSEHKLTDACHLYLPEYTFELFAIKIFRFFAIVCGDSRRTMLKLFSLTAVVRKAMTYFYTVCFTNLCHSVFIRRLRAGWPESRCSIHFRDGFFTPSHPYCLWSRPNQPNGY